MVRLVLGRAGSGKTADALYDVRNKMRLGMKHLYYIVPEQYSHDAERQLLKICGDTLSLHGEVLSFSRLANRVFAELGGLAAQNLDDGGRILLMSRALSAVSNQLSVYSRTEQKADLLEKLVAVAKEFKSACISPEALEKAGGELIGPLKQKITDLSLILGAYDSHFNDDSVNPDDKLNRLADVIGDTTLFESGYIWFDGFTDFTVQELLVIEELIRMDVNMTICLTCDGLDGGEEIFQASRQTAQLLLRMAKDNGRDTEITHLHEQVNGRAAELSFLERNLFLHCTEHFEGVCTAIQIMKASTPGNECEMAAAKVLELVRSGYRWREIAVAVSDLPSYGALAEHIFEKYGVPVFVSKKTSISTKPPAALIDDALDIITNGWDYESVFRYLKTGLTGLSLAECDILENYALLWNLRGSIWTREADWVQPPSGYDRDHTDGDKEILRHLNELRHRLVKPLVRLQKELKTSDSYSEKLRVLYTYLSDIGLPERLQAKADEFSQSGELQLADEYKQLWEILVKAFEQFNTILGDQQGSVAEFARLWKLLISQYSIGAIPVALDRVGLGDLSRQRRRDLKCLIVIGATDDVMPRTGAGGGILSDSERAEIISLGVRLSGTSEDRLYREMNSIYSSLTLPSDRLIVTYPTGGFGGGDKRPSFVVKRLKALFDILESTDASMDFRMSAALPAFELAAASAGQAEGTNKASAAAAYYFKQDAASAGRLARIAASADLSRGKLSENAAAKLYGNQLVISASRVDKFYACRFLYFLQYGLNAHPRKPAGFDAPTAGTFMHYILENVVRDIRDMGGFAGISDERCLQLTYDYVDKYVDDVLDNFRDKTNRFKYLFNRLRKDTAFIVLDMVHELQNSEFSPLDFELEFSDKGDIPPHVITGGEQQLKVKGFIDRLDGWENNGKLYLRIVDYKTGKKTFSLSDVWYGMNMQMLIYLFALQKNGEERYGREIVPAGILYAPARDEILQAPRNSDDAKVMEERAKKLRRSGLLLQDDVVVEAMEHGDSKKYLPVKISKDSILTGESLAGLEQLGKLSAHIDKMLLQIAGSVHGGSISAEPYFKDRTDHACQFCDYQAVCHFSEKDGDKRRYLKKLKTDDAWELITKEADQ